MDTTFMQRYKKKVKKHSFCSKKVQKIKKKVLLVKKKGVFLCHMVKKR